MRERERERETHQRERETSISCLLYMSQSGIDPATQACALSRDRTCNLSTYKTMPQPTKLRQPGPSVLLLYFSSFSAIFIPLTFSPQYLLECTGHMSLDTRVSLHNTESTCVFTRAYVCGYFCACALANPLL